MYTLQSFTFIFDSVFLRNTGLGTDIFIKLEYIARSLVKIKSIPDWHLFISRMETKWTKWYAMTSHVIAYRSLELLFGTHTFHFNCFFDYFNCVFTQIRCLSRVLLNVLFVLWLGACSVLLVVLPVPLMSLSFCIIKVIICFMFPICLDLYAIRLFTASNFRSHDFATLLS